MEWPAAVPAPVAAQNRLVQTLQFRSRINAQLLGEDGPNTPIVGERIGLPAAPVQGQHVLSRQPFIQRMGPTALGQGRQQRGVLTQP